MTMQLAIVSVVVAACAIHAIVAIAPAGLRRRAAALLVRLPSLRGNARLARIATASGACGCSGCEHSRGPVAPANKGKVIALRRVG